MHSNLLPTGSGRSVGSGPKKHPVHRLFALERTFSRRRTPSIRRQPRLDQAFSDSLNVPSR